jgi:hypothetical protein
MMVVSNGGETVTQVATESSLTQTKDPALAALDIRHPASPDGEQNLDGI